MLENFIGGKFLPCNSYIDSYDPSTGEVYCKVPNSGKEEIEAAVEAAREAFPAWSSRSPQERSLVLNRLADVLEQSLEELAQAESKDQDHPGALLHLREDRRQQMGSLPGSAAGRVHGGGCPGRSGPKALLLPPHAASTRGPD